MDLSKILVITGKSGLFHLISKTKSSVIVESIPDKKRFPAFTEDGIATLDSILIFTTEDDVTLDSVLKTIYRKENGANLAIPLTDNNKMKLYFEEVLPNYDKERVYVSNIKKILKWYNILAENNLFDSEEEATTTESDTVENNTPEAENVATTAPEENASEEENPLA